MTKRSSAEQCVAADRRENAAPAERERSASKMEGLVSSIERQIQAVVDAETAAWNARDADALLSLFHPDIVWPWPPDASSHDPIQWVMPFGRFDRIRWKRSWEELFGSHEIVHNNRKTLRIAVSEQGDGAFAVVDVDTLWRNRASSDLFHWKGRACKVYSRVGEQWLFFFQTGLLNYSGISVST